jgi:hypothetical protein
MHRHLVFVLLWVATCQAMAADPAALYEQAQAVEAHAMREAVRLYWEAVKAGNGKAALRLSEIYRTGAPGVPRDVAESARLYEVARLRGERTPDGSSPEERAARAAAERQAARRAHEARDAAVAKERAADEARAAAALARGQERQLGSGGRVATPASGEAAELYAQGRALEMNGNARDAIRVYRRAARAGSGLAARRAGDIFNCGSPGVARDYAESLQWYETARGLGERNLPVVTRDGQGC